MAAQPALLVSSEDRLEPEHFVRRLLPLVEMTLGSELRSRCNLQGGFGYDPVRLLCVWLYGFMQGEHSSRRLEDLCRYDARYEFLAGSCRPDHSTLSRYRGSLGESLDAMLLRICEQAQSQGILKRRAMAVDGTKVQARLTQWRKAREQSEKEDAVLEEAVTMVSHGKYLVGYNVQAAVDMDSTLVVGYVVSEHPEDSSLMGMVLDATVVHSGGLSAKVVADRGYTSSSNALALKERGLEGYLPERVPRRRVPFKQDQDGIFRCAKGHAVTERPWVDKNRGGKLYRQLRVSRCSGCELALQCPGKGKQRAMKVLAQDSGDERHQCVERARSDDGRALMRCRGSTVEYLFAQLKQRFGFRRFSMFGKAKARLEFGLLVLAYNLERLLSLSRTRLRPLLRLQNAPLESSARRQRSNYGLRLAA